MLFASIFSRAGSNAGYNIVMFGDSITQAGNWPKLLERNDVFNFGIAGEITGNMRKNTGSVVMKQPKICFILGGINDIGYNFQVKQIFENIRGIALEMRAMGIIPVVQSTIFVVESDMTKSYWNPKVEELNAMLLKFCTNTNIEYLDLNEFLSSNKQLKSELSIDGIHLSDEAYSLWAEKIKHLLKKYEI